MILSGGVECRRDNPADAARNAGSFVTVVASPPGRDGAAAVVACSPLHAALQVADLLKPGPIQPLPPAVGKCIERFGFGTGIALPHEVRSSGRASRSET